MVLGGKAPIIIPIDAANLGNRGSRSFQPITILVSAHYQNINNSMAPSTSRIPVPVDLLQWFIVKSEHYIFEVNLHFLIRISL